MLARGSWTGARLAAPHWRRVIEEVAELRAGQDDLAATFEITGGG